MYEFAAALVMLIRAPFWLALYLLVRVLTVLNNIRSKASDPGRVRLSRAKLRRLCPEYFASGIDPLDWFDQVAGLRAIRIHSVANQLLHGDSRAAVVMSVAPLLVAAYTDELDCVALLRFPDGLTQEYGLHVRSRLLTVNCYFPEGWLARDLERGPLAYNRYVNFQPFVADFLTDDVDRVRQRKAKIREDEWIRAWVLGERYLSKFGGQARDGNPALCSRPAAVVRPEPID